MNEPDKLAIERFADCHSASERDALLVAAIAAHRRALASGETDTPHQRFMSEVDNPCPDFGLRARYRRELLESRRHQSEGLQPNRTPGALST